MAKKTLLEIVQDILNEMDGDEVNSINDTIEATQVANIVRTTYEKIASSNNWPYQRQLTQIDGLSDTTKPTHMLLADDIKEIDIVHYDKATDGSTRTKFEKVHYIHPDSFLITINNTRDSSSDTIQQVVDFGGTTLLIRNNVAPQHWTSFDDKHIIFDSFNNEVDDTLVKSKTQVIAFIEQPFVLTDAAIPPMPAEQFPQLIAEAKSTAFFVLNQSVNSKAEQDARKQRHRMSRNSFVARGGIDFRGANYGRRRTNNPQISNRTDK